MQPPAQVLLRAPLRLLVTMTLAPVQAAVAQSAASVRAAARYSAEHDGDAVLVFRHDSLAFEEYQNGYDGRLPHPLASGTKVFSCVLAALGQGDGLLTLDEPVTRTVTELEGDSQPDAPTWTMTPSGVAVGSGTSASCSGPSKRS